MNTFEAIEGRRSIRKFRTEPLPKETVEKILAAAIRAPSPNNYQPWRFTIIQGSQKDQMVDVMRRAVIDHASRGECTGNAKWMAEIMAKAPVTVFVHNPEGTHPWLARAENNVIYQRRSAWELATTLSIGAAIQNMLLAAHDLGIGSLWIGEVWKVYIELNAWLDNESQMVAAIAFGYSDEKPAARPRKPLDDVVHWL